MKFLIFFFSLQASASFLTPLAELRCKGKDYEVEVKLNDQKLNSLTLKKKKKLVKSCSFSISDESRTKRGSDIVKTFYTDLDNCDGKTELTAYTPVLQKGMIVFSGRGKIKKAEIHHLENSNALSCKVISLQEKKVESFSVIKK